MTNEQDTRNIALKLFRVVNGTGDGGSELAFDCLNSGIQKGWMRLAKIGAKDKVMNELERSIDAKDKELAEVRAKLEAAEARIKASQEQEPVGYMTDSGMYKIDGSFWQAVGDVVFKWRKLYEQPSIPPELAELQRENAELRKQLEVREGYELVVLKSGSYGWRYAVTQSAKLLRDIDRNGGLKQGGEQYPNGLCCHDMADRLDSMLSAAPKGE